MKEQTEVACEIYENTDDIHYVVNIKTCPMCGQEFPKWKFILSTYMPKECPACHRPLQLTVEAKYHAREVASE